MSTSDPRAASAEIVAEAVVALAAAIGEPGRIADAHLRVLIASALRLYAAKAQDGMRSPLPPGGGGVSVDDAMVLTTDLLHALNVQLFELSMWQAMTGNTIAPHQRIHAPQNR